MPLLALLSAFFPPETPAPAMTLSSCALRITAGVSPQMLTIDSVMYTLSSGSPTYIPKEHRQALVNAAAAKGITLSPAVM